MTVPSTARLKQ